MKKSKLPIVGAIIAGVGVIGLFGVFSSENKAALLFGSLILIVVGAVLLILGIKKNSALKPQGTQEPVEIQSKIENLHKTEEIHQPVKTPTTTVAPISNAAVSKPEMVDGNKNTNWLPLTVNGYYKIYEYLETVCLDKDSMNSYEYVKEKANEKQRVLSFEFEENNPFDSEAVIIMLEDKKIGYVHKGMVQKMLHDYAKKGYQVCANINTFSPEEITYYIGFYKPRNACKQYEIPIKNKNFTENCREGEILSVEFDVVEERFYITDNTGENICILPEKAEDYARESHEIPVEVGANSESVIFFK